MTDMRTAFAAEASELLDEDPLTAIVLAEISADLFAKAAARHPDRVLNVGIREQLMVSVGGGLALAGLRPIVHTYAPFLVERAFEQVKLDLGHQGGHAVLVSIGASYDAARAGRTHQAPEDVALIDSVPGFSVIVPGHPAEVRGLLREAVNGLGSGPGGGSAYLRLSAERNREARPLSASLQMVRPGRRAVVVAVGPMLDPVLDAPPAAGLGQARIPFGPFLALACLELIFAHDWIDAWNAHDLERILSHYEDEALLTSPVALKLLNGDGTVRGKAALRAYFLRGLEAYPNLRFDLVDTLWGTETIVVFYINNVRGNKTAEVMQISPEGMIRRVWANYDQ